MNCYNPQYGLRIQVRYTRELTNLGTACREENLRYAASEYRLPVKQCALVLVDCWENHPLVSLMERTQAICRDKIAPLLKACRKSGVTVMHMPSPAWADNYKSFNPFARQQLASLLKAGPFEWPPEDFRRRKGEYAVFNVPFCPYEKRYRQWAGNNPPETLRISRFLAPQDGDLVLRNGTELHTFCSRNKILHLLYAGFAANICVQHRDYGCRMMRTLGYSIILVRDCTTAIEMPETLAERRMTLTAIRNIEMKVGPSTTSTVIRDACRKLR